MPSIATNTSVDRAELLQFIQPRHRAVLFTYRADGTPQASPVTCGVVDGALVVSTYPDRVKAVNVRRTGRAGAVVVSDEWNGPWVQIDGSAEVVDGEDAVEPLVEYYRSISGEHPDWEDYRAAMRRQGKSLIRLVPDRWGPVATGGFPPRLVNGDE